MTNLFERSDAILSPCELYRYRLSRIWDDSRPLLVWAMLNPSTADSFLDDPTIRRVRSFSHDADAGGFFVVNLFAWRSSSPEKMFRVEREGQDIVGPDNDQHIREACSGHRVVVAWGAGASAEVGDRRANGVLALLASIGVKPLCLGRTKLGEAPRHPLYVPGGTPLVPF